MPELSILAEAQHLSDVYGSRPPYYGPEFIACESRNKSVQEIDSNQKWSRGILQFQDSTWQDFSKESGIIGDPMDKIDVVGMALWGVEHGLIERWSCSKLEGLIP
jgi:hypothetical protein